MHSSPLRNTSGSRILAGAIPTASSDEPCRARRAEVSLAMMQRHGNDIGGKLNTVTELLGAEVAITIIFLVGRRLTHSLLVNAPSLGPPAKPVFEEAA